MLFLSRGALRKTKPYRRYKSAVTTGELTKTIRVFYMKLSILQISWWVYVGGGLPNFSYGIDFHLELEFLF